MAKTKEAENAIRYNREHTKRVFINLNKTYDADIIERLDAEQNKQGLIKALLRAHYGLSK